MIKNPEYFSAIVESGSLTKAAKQLFVSQPYLSQYLKQLETNLDTELFDHSTSPLRLTYAGELYYQYVLKVIQLTENINRVFQDIKGQDSGRLRIGLPTWRASCTLPVVYPEFHRRYPNIHLELTESPPARLIDGLLLGNLDLIIMNTGSIPLTVNHKKICYEELYDEQILFAAPTRHPAVQKFIKEADSGRSPLTLLNHLPLISTKSVRLFPVSMDQLFRKYQLEPEILLETSNFTTTINLVAAGIACAFAMEGSAMVGSCSEHVTYFPVEQPDSPHTIVAIYHKDSYLTRLSQLFIQTAKEAFDRVLPVGLHC